MTVGLQRITFNSNGNAWRDINHRGTLDHLFGLIIDKLETTREVIVVKLLS